MLARVVLVALAIVLGVSRAEAHPLDLGYLRIDSSGDTLTVAFDLEASVGAELAGMRDGRAALADAEGLANVTYRLAPITTNAGTCSWTTTRAALRTETKTLAQTGTAECPPGSTTLTWDFPVIAKLPSTFELLVKSNAFATVHVSILRAEQPTLTVTRHGAGLGFTDLVISGFEHIGAAPGEWYDAGGWRLADGIDHVLFVIALLLAGGTLVSLVGIATGFTIGHSITLALATTGVLRIPPSIVEPLVALTLVAAAAEAFTGTLAAHRIPRWTIATGFGLVHGFAFASALGELQLAGGSLAMALFGFNLGVELGQIAVIAVFAPLIMMAHRRRPDATHIAVRLVAGAIFLAGCYWFVERTFL